MDNDNGWEYFLELINGAGFPLSQDRLDSLGKVGWELVTVYDGWAYFKRKKKSPHLPSDKNDE